MNEKLKKLTGKNPNDFEPVAFDIVNNSDEKLFEELVESEDFLFDFVKQNVANRLEKACNNSNYLNLLCFLKYYSPSYENFIINTLVKFSNDNLDDVMLKKFEMGTHNEKIYCAKYFSQRPNSLATDILKNLAFSTNLSLSANCAEALAKIGDTSLYAKSLEMLNSDDGFEQLDAVRFLVSYGNEDAVDSIINIMQKSTMADNIAGELLYLTDLFNIYKKDTMKGLYVFQTIIDGLGEILNLSQVFDFQLYEFIEMLSNMPINSASATVLLAASDKFDTLTENDEYLYDETKDTKKEIFDIKKLLKTFDTAMLFSLSDDELKENSPFIFTALEYTENEDRVRRLLKAQNPAVVLKALEILKMLEVITPTDKDIALNSVQDENLKNIIKAM